MSSGSETLSAPGRGADTKTPAAKHDSPVRDVGETAARRYLAFLAAAFVVIFGVIWIYTAALPMAYLDRDRPAWLAKRTMLTSCELGSVAIFGDSRAMAGIDPRELPFTSTNFSFSGSSPIEAYFALKRVLRCPNRPKAVIIAYSVGKYMQDEDFWNIGARVGILDFADIRSVQKESAALHDPEIQKLRAGDHLAPIVLAALFSVRFPPFYFDSLVNGYVFARYFHNIKEERQILADRGHAFFGTEAGSDALATEVSMGGFQASPLVSVYVNGMLAALEKDRIPVVLLSLPVNDATCGPLNATLRPGFARHLQSLTAAFPNTRLAGAVIPCWPDRLFGDAFHLNATGTALYNRLVAHWLLPDKTTPAGSPQVVER